MENKIPWDRAFEVQEPRVVRQRQPVIPVTPPQLFKNPTRLTWIVNFLLFLSIITAVVAMWSDYLEIDFIGKVKDGLYQSEEAMEADATVNDTRQGIVGLSLMAVSLSALIFFLIWVHRANFNARGLGATGMEYTPGWAVGWYFIPIANFWKPYYAMKEIYQVSKNPGHWLSQEVGSIVGVWWLFWIISGVLGKAAFKLSMRAESLDELMHAGKIMLASNIADVISAISCIVLVCAVHKMQLARAGLTAPYASEFGSEVLTVRED